VRTSLLPNQVNPEKMLELFRAEWGFENELQFRRDVTFREDKTRMTRKPITSTLTFINNLVIALFNKQGFSNHAQARRIFCAKPSSALQLVGQL
jgi:predicted transposase YbfD/YdcC